VAGTSRLDAPGSLLAACSVAATVKRLYAPGEVLPEVVFHHFLFRAYSCVEVFFNFIVEFDHYSTMNLSFMRQ